MSNAADCIRQFLKFSILTNTYQEARGWLDRNKDKFADEIELMADSLSKPKDSDSNILW